jgi:hypothetical protein
LIKQDWQNRSEQVEGANLVYFDRAAGGREVKIVGAHRHPEGCEPDHDVDATPRRNDRVTGRCERACIRDVQRQNQRIKRSLIRALIQTATDLVEDIVQGLFAARRDGDSGAATGEFARECCADATGGAD